MRVDMAYVLILPLLLLPLRYGHVCLPKRTVKIECVDAKNGSRIELQAIERCKLQVELPNTLCRPSKRSVLCLQSNGKHHLISVECEEGHTQPQGSPTDTLKVYYADVPRQYNWGLWPADTAFTPFGQLVNPREAWYQTSSLAARQIFDVNLRQLSLLVDDINEADLVFVNYHHEAIFKDPAARFETHEAFWRMAEEYLPLMYSKPHFFVISVSDVEAFNKGDSFWFWAFAHEQRRRYLTALIVELSTEYEIPTWFGSSMIPIPYPSALHLNMSRKSKSHSRLVTPDAAAMTKLFRMKTWLVTWVLESSQTTDTQQLTRCLTTECTAREIDCRLVEESPDGEPSALTRLESFRASWFCLVPPGQALFGKVFWDCLAALAIPVGMAPEWHEANTYLPFSHLLDWSDIIAAVPVNFSDSYIQRNLTSPHGYIDPWTPSRLISGQQLVIGEAAEDTSATSAGINGSSVGDSDCVIGGVAGNSGGGVIDYLQREYPKHRRETMLRRLIEVRHLFQYAAEPCRHCLRGHRMGGIDRYDDGFTLAMKTLVHSLCARGLFPVDKCGKNATQVAAGSSEVQGV